MKGCNILQKTRALHLVEAAVGNLSKNSLTGTKQSKKVAFQQLNKHLRSLLEAVQAFLRRYFVGERNFI